MFKLILSSSSCLLSSKCTTQSNQIVFAPIAKSRTNMRRRLRSLRLHASLWARSERDAHTHRQQVVEKIRWSWFMVLISSYLPVYICVCVCVCSWQAAREQEGIFFYISLAAAFFNASSFIIIIIIFFTCIQTQVQAWAAGGSSVARQHDLNWLAPFALFSPSLARSLCCHELNNFQRHASKKEPKVELMKEKKRDLNSLTHKQNEKKILAKIKKTYRKLKVK